MKDKVMILPEYPNSVNMVSCLAVRVETPYK